MVRRTLTFLSIFLAFNCGFASTNKDLRDARPFGQVCHLIEGESPWTELKFVFTVEVAGDGRFFLVHNVSLVMAKWSAIDSTEKDAGTRNAYSSYFMRFAKDDVFEALTGSQFFTTYAFGQDSTVVGQFSVQPKERTQSSQFQGSIEQLYFESGGKKLRVVTDMDGESVTSNWICEYDNPWQHHFSNTGVVTR